MPAYYNEIDPYAAQWLRNLIAAGHIAPGDVDERSIVDVRADDLRGYRQCHFFAGIGLWSYALRKAGWSDDEEVWTGSCPCQPFSAAGKREAFDDERDLWPAFFALIRERRPVVVAGEQVASRLGLAWLDAVHADMEGEAYTVGAVDTCSAGVGSPNIRQRLYWVAHSISERGRGGELGREDAADVRQSGEVVRMADPECGATERHGHPLAGEARGAQGETHQRERLRPDAGNGGEPVGMDDSASPRWDARTQSCGSNETEDGRTKAIRCEAWAETWGRSSALRPGPTNGFWRAADWLCCTDGKWRPVESGAFPLVTGAAARLGRLRAYGNAINAEVAIEFLRAARSCIGVAQ